MVFLGKHNMIKRSTYIFILAVLGIILVLYIASSVFASGWSYNILSFVGAAASCIVLVHTFLKTKVQRNMWLMFCCGALSWMLCDLAWAIYSLSTGKDPNQDTIFTIAFLLPNIFVAIGIGFLFHLKTQKWNRLQWVTDVISVTASLIILFWVLYGEQNSKFLTLKGIILFMYILCDMFCIGCIFVWYTFCRQQKAFSNLRMIILGVVLFSVSDIYYTYLDLNGLYTPNSIVDVINILSIMLFAFAGLRENMYPVADTNTGYSNPVNNGYSKKGLMLLLIPVAMIALKGFYLTETLFLVFIVALHQVVSGHLLNAEKNEMLLIQEKRLNARLEEGINERTQELLKMNESLETLSKIDQITNLYNRRYFMNTLDTMLSGLNNEETAVLFFMDLDRFKSINDAYGHDIGDKVLIEVSSRMDQWNKNRDAILARLGGDEFVVAFWGKLPRKKIEQMAQEIIQCFDKPVYIHPYQFKITICIGITVYPLDAQDKRTLIRNADIAMYHAKSLGISHYAFYSSCLNESITRKCELEMLLEQADYDKEFQLLFQPLYSIPDKELVGVEALLRWNHPEKGLIMPSEFIPIAEETQVIIPLGEWVLDKALCYISQWNKKYGLSLQIGVNISSKQLDSMHFIENLKMMLKKNDASPEWLDFEITEGVAMKGEMEAVKKFAKIKQVGISVSIDDFGTGYSSLSYLKRFHIDRLKIVKPLVDNIVNDNRDAQIVKAIIVMAKALGIKTVAEGIENEEQLNKLIELHCDQVQGYHLGRPFPAEEFEAAFLKKEMPKLQSLVKKYLFTEDKVKSNSI